MMNKTTELINKALAFLLAASVLSLTGCGSTWDDSRQVDTAVQYKTPEVQTAADTVQTQDAPQEQSAETGGIGIMRAYSDQEKERMKELQQSYQNETIYPENLIQEVDSAEEVTEGILCYIRSTGEYYLPDRELTDEELLEIIDCNFRITLNVNRKTKEEYEAEDLAERSMLEKKVQSAGGVSEEKAIEIAEKAMETDIGARSGRMELHIDYRGWSSFLWDVTNWNEYRERGEIAYFFQFDDTEDGWYSYHCVVNALDGSILDAYGLTLSESSDYDIVYYTH